MRVLSLVCLAGVAFALVPAAVLCGGEKPAAGGYAWAIVPLELGLGRSEFESALGLAVSGDEILLTVSRDRAEELAAASAALPNEVGTFGLVPGLRLWTAVGRIPDETAREFGLTILHRSDAATLFEARLDSAYGLLNRGFFVAEAKLRAIDDLKREHFGAGLTERLLAARPMTPGRERFIAGLADAVSSDTLRSRIRFLNYDDAAQAYRSRFAPRHEMRQEVAPYLRDLMAAYLVPNGGTVEVQEFEPTLPTDYRGDDSVFVNVIASKAGRRTSAHYIVCAHYDAIAVRDPAWQAAPDAWMTMPAPGADDDATGVAALLETARLVSALDLDVGVTFVAFSGEELLLLGSADYVDRLTPADSVIAVINLDMLGFAQGGRYIGLTHDRRSKWLSDFLGQTATDIGLESETEQRDFTGIPRGDHASFWAVGTPAVMLADRQDSDGEPLNPYYHKLADTLGTLDMEQVRENAQLVVAFLARFAEVQADTVCDLALTEGSVQWVWDGGPYAPLVAGDSVSVTVRALNSGGSMAAPEIYTLRALLGSDSDGQEVAYQTLAINALSGEYATAHMAWKTSPDLVGDVKYFFTLTPVNEDVEADLADNSVVVPLRVMPPSVVLRGLHVFPNPSADPASAGLAFEIWHPNWQGLDNTFTGRMEVWIYDIEGNRVGGGTLLRTLTGVEDIALGDNAVELKRLLPDGVDLGPGLYICFADLKVTGAAGTAEAKTKFAIAR